MRHRSIACLLALAGHGLVAQNATSVPPGFASTPVLTESTRAPLVRGLCVLADGYLVAIDRDLEWRQTGAATRLLMRLHAGEDFGFLLATAPHRAVVGELHTGSIRELDLALGGVASTFAGVPNAFDAVALPNGDLLLSANPTWPASGAHTGVWLVGPGRTPRELLPLSGPSAPLVLAPNGDLIVGELGPVVPPPNGARLLRFPAPLLQQAIAGATLSASQASSIGTGHAGIYDLAYDDLGRLHVTDPASGIVRHCAPGTLSPTGITLDVGPGRYALALTFVAHPNAPFRGWQPPAEAPALVVTHSDFAQSFVASRLHPRRPTLQQAPAGPIAPGSATLTVSEAPAGGIAFFALSLAGPSPEAVAATPEGVPLWLGIPMNAADAVWSEPIDAAGRATTSLLNPGGYALALTLQSIALGPPGASAVGSTVPHIVNLQP